MHLRRRRGLLHHRACDEQLGVGDPGHALPRGIVYRDGAFIMTALTVALIQRISNKVLMTPPSHETLLKDGEGITIGAASCSSVARRRLCRRLVTNARLGHAVAIRLRIAQTRLKSTVVGFGGGVGDP